jgi:hypothetical protein
MALTRLLLMKTTMMKMKVPPPSSWRRTAAR